MRNGKRTRETGGDESSVELCAFCNECALTENSYYDGNCTWDEYLAAIEELKKRYKRELVKGQLASRMDSAEEK